MRLVLLFLILVITISCKKASREIGGEMLEKAVKKLDNLAPSNHSLVNVFGDDLFESLSKKYDDKFLKEIGKILSDNPTLTNFVKENPNAIKIMYSFGNTNIRGNVAVVKYFTSIIDDIGELAFNEKYIFTSSRDFLFLKDKNSGKTLAEISNSKIVANPGKGGIELNNFLAEREMIPNIPYQVGTHKYLINDLGQYKSVNGTLIPPIAKPLPLRNDIQQGLSKKYKDAIPLMDNGKIVNVKAGYPNYKDDGGHFIANRFGGGSEMYNYIPMSKKLNRSGGGWFEMEKRWAKAIDKGEKVSYNIEPIYNSKSKRPDYIKVSYEIGGERFTELFNNNKF
ncbi:hypothetical protein Belba_2866 [Belliella baltica DSM 15883]|uniref:Type VII secretion system protein EssD-like domain-containing protein n=1 Tax=Belliella baltica (strain DSM 15883 / CIP 108006 / LMG 21964 / BA134) TaxID=866536 RepID=I3Z830_BELBD|nr:DNA/RNA non-specific endonuclease [Belliella baltica]AFL85398.1 hypothetical protein Belba_2866 [Belliella baltica DSM 15883]